MRRFTNISSGSSIVFALGSHANYFFPPPFYKAKSQLSSVQIKYTCQKVVLFKSKKRTRGRKREMKCADELKARNEDLRK